VPAGLPPVVVVPAYQPTAHLVGIVSQLLADPSQIVIVVDDGSTSEHRCLFETLRAHPRVHLLRHAVNLGKGRALKTAFNHFLVNLPEEHVGIVTADADGQHLVEDVRRVAGVLSEHPNDLVLGTRRLHGSIPWKSAIGNRITKHIFSRLLGRKIEDTQTGLRGVPRSFAASLLRLSASRYEFELEMLVKAVHEQVRVREVPIATVYENQNRGSHFDPVLDSLRIYFVFLRFVALSMATAILDFLVFAAAYAVSSNILLSTAGARVVAGLFNYSIARALVFKSTGPAGRELAKYVALVVWLMTLSYALLTTLVVFLGWSVYVSKLVAEGTLFVASFAVQRLLIFGRSEPEPESAATDWDTYYMRPARPARLTRAITTRRLLDLMRRHLTSQPRGICELGGANSCFYASMREAFPQVDYSVIDNNPVGLELLSRRWGDDQRLHARNEDVRELPEQVLDADIVYSVGLIEHFPPEQTATVIRKHFSCVRPGGLVIVTFPTPTWLYRITRALAEACHAWRFPDERPLTFEEVEAEIRKYGTIVESRINWAIVLTQGIVVARA
jgi:glycosyltransferase involved in cell wall biosynthesis